MNGSPRTTRRPLVVLGLACGLSALLAAGCADHPRPGGATNGKAEKARKEAESLAVAGVNSAAERQSKCVPELAEARKVRLFGGRLVIDPDDWDVDVATSRTSATAKDPPAPPEPKAPPTPPAPKAESQVAKGRPAPKLAPRPGSPVVIDERVVSSVPYPTEAEAKKDALALACEVVERRLAALDPPVRYRPSVAEVEAEFLPKDSHTVRPPNEKEQKLLDESGVVKPGEKRVYVEFDVEVTADQIRELRSQERVSAGLRLLGGVLAVALVGFLFLRADEWTKGYLTSWLAVGAVALAGGAAAALILV
jgi:hypothetical protein